MSNDTLIRVEHLKKYFAVRGRMSGRRFIKAVDDVTFDIKRGETFGLVGESGSGKSTLGRTITRLYDPTGGKIRFEGTDIAPLKGNDLDIYRKRMQIIFQDPYSSLNPYMDVERLIGEPLALSEKLTRVKRRERIETILDKVGMDAADLEKYPHEFSGGQRQRIGIARALVVHPDFVLCDEPISALDVSIQAQVVNMLQDLQEEMGLTYLFVAHDLSMVRHISHQIGVMYLGHIVEISPAGELYKMPLHPYTKALLSAIPIPDPIRAREKKRVRLEGDINSSAQDTEGCPFLPRCPYAMGVCGQKMPELIEAAPGHFVACYAVNGEKE